MIDDEDDIDTPIYPYNPEDHKHEKDFDTDVCRTLIRNLKKGEADSSDFWEFARVYIRKDKSDLEDRVLKKMKKGKMSQIEAMIKVLNYFYQGYI